jgi:hypothetical protein
LARQCILKSDKPSEVLFSRWLWGSMFSPTPLAVPMTVIE